MSDRNAKLSIETDASSMGKAADDAKKLRQEIEKVGDAGSDASGDLNKTAAALEKVESAEQDVTGSSRDAANALEGVGQAAQESSQTAVSGAQSAAQALEGVTVAAGEERGALLAAGEAAQQSGVETKQALDQVTAAEEEAAEGARELGRETGKAATEAQGFKDGVRQIESMADALRKSGLSLEIQRQGLAAVIKEVEKLAAEEISAGAAGRENANLAGQALIGLKARLADVNAEIKREVEAFRLLGAEGGEGFDAAARGAFDFETVAAKAAQRVKESWESLNDNLTLTPGQLRLTAQAVAATEIAIVQAGERGQAVTLEQLALYERLQEELRQLTAQANALSNASRDNAVGLKQTGAQIAGISGGVAQLASLLPGTASKIGLVVGNVGQLGSVIEGLQAGVKSLDLNTIGAAGSTARLGVQLSAVVAVAAAAAAAGVKLANVNDQNAESTERLWKAIKKLAGEEIKEAKDRISGLQTGLQTVAISFADAITGADDLGAASKNLTNSVIEVVLGAGRGGEAIKLYNIAIRDGLEPTKALTLATGESAKIMKFYEDSARGGAAGHRLWLRALRESAGDSEKMEKFVAAHRVQLDRLTEAQKLNNDAVRESHALVRSGEADLLALAAASDQIAQAQNGSTAAMNEGLESIRQMIALSDLNSVELAERAALLEQVLSKTDGLTTAERTRIEAVIELAKRGGALTETEQAYGAALAQSIINGEKAKAAMVERADVAAALKGAIDALVASTAAESSALETNETAIEKAVKSAEKLLASNQPLDVIERLRLSTIVELGKQVGELAEQQDRLTAASAATAEAEGASGAAEASLILVKSGRVDMIQREIDAKAEMIRALSIEKTSTENLTTATQAIIKIQEGGKTVYTNLTEAQNASTESMKAAGEAAKSAGDQFGDVLVRRLSDGHVVITQVGQSAGETADNFSRIGNRAAEAGPAVAAAFEKWKGGVGEVDEVIDKMRTLEALFASLEERPLRIAANVGVMAKALERAGDSATKASGFASGKVQETG